MTENDELTKQPKEVEEALTALGKALIGQALEQAQWPLLAHKQELDAKLKGSGWIAQGEGVMAAWQKVPGIAGTSQSLLHQNRGRGVYQ